MKTVKGKEQEEYEAKLQNKHLENYEAPKKKAKPAKEKVKPAPKQFLAPGADLFVCSEGKKIPVGKIKNMNVSQDYVKNYVQCVIETYPIDVYSFQKAFFGK